MFQRLAIIALLSGFCLAFQSCTLIHPPPQELITKGDSASLADYYKEQAQELREEAKAWDKLAESYGHVKPYGRAETRDHAVHCRAIAATYRKAADEADALAAEHLQELPQGKIE